MTADRFKAKGADRFSTEDAEIVVVPIDGDCSSLLNDSDRAYINSLGSPRRRAEVAAWRAVVRERLGGAAIGYDGVGAPVITDGGAGKSAEDSARTKNGEAEKSAEKSAENSAKNSAEAGTNSESETKIGVAHTDRYAAVIFSDRRCAIDMESTERRFDKVAARFISPAESGLPESGHRLFKCAVWCAKEALYKYSGRRELDLLRDLQITSTDIEGGKLTGTIALPDGARSEHTLRLLPYDEKYLIVYIA